MLQIASEAQRLLLMSPQMLYQEVSLDRLVVDAGAIQGE